VAGARIDIGAFELQAGAAPPALPGDYNGDKKVNAADYTLWRNTLGMFVDRYSGADGDGSGRIDMGDHGVWKSHFGQSLPGAGTVAVENPPTSAVEIASPLAQAAEVSPIPAPAKSAAVRSRLTPPPSEGAPISRARHSLASSRSGHHNVDDGILLLSAPRAAASSAANRDSTAHSAEGRCDRDGHVSMRDATLGALDSPDWDRLWGEWRRGRFGAARG
jgi:hypothetical protein